MLSMRMILMTMIMEMFLWERFWLFNLGRMFLADMAAVIRWNDQSQLVIEIDALTHYIEHHFLEGRKIWQGRFIPCEQVWELQQGIDGGEIFDQNGSIGLTIWMHSNNFKKLPFWEHDNALQILGENMKKLPAQTAKSLNLVHFPIPWICKGDNNKSVQHELLNSIWWICSRKLTAQ